MKNTHLFLLLLCLGTAANAQQQVRYETLDLQTEHRHLKRIFRACEPDWEPERRCILLDSLGRGCIVWVPAETGYYRHQTVVFTTNHLKNGICQHDLNARHAWQCYQTYPCGHTPIEHAYTHCDWLSRDPGELPLQAPSTSIATDLLAKENLHPTQFHLLKYAP